MNICTKYILLCISLLLLALPLKIYGKDIFSKEFEPRFEPKIEPRFEPRRDKSLVDSIFYIECFFNKDTYKKGDSLDVLILYTFNTKADREQSSERRFIYPNKDCIVSLLEPSYKGRLNHIIAKAGNSSSYRCKSDSLGFVRLKTKIPDAAIEGKWILKLNAIASSFWVAEEGFAEEEIAVREILKWENTVGSIIGSDRVKCGILDSLELSCKKLEAQNFLAIRYNSNLYTKKIFDPQEIIYLYIPTEAAKYSIDAILYQIDSSGSVKISSLKKDFEAYNDINIACSLPKYLYRGDIAFVYPIFSRDDTARKEKQKILVCLSRSFKDSNNCLHRVCDTLYKNIKWRKGKAQTSLPLKINASSALNVGSALNANAASDIEVSISVLNKDFCNSIKSKIEIVDIVSAKIDSNNVYFALSSLIGSKIPYNYNKTMSLDFLSKLPKAKSWNISTQSINALKEYMQANYSFTWTKNSSIEDKELTTNILEIISNTFAKERHLLSDFFANKTLEYLIGNISLNQSAEDLQADSILCEVFRYRKILSILEANSWKFTKEKKFLDSLLSATSYLDSNYISSLSEKPQKENVFEIKTQLPKKCRLGDTIDFELHINLKDSVDFLCLEIPLWAGVEVCGWSVCEDRGECEAEAEAEAAVLGGAAAGSGAEAGGVASAGSEIGSDRNNSHIGFLSNSILIHLKNQSTKDLCYKFRLKTKFKGKFGIEGFFVNEKLYPKPHKIHIKKRRKKWN